MPDKLPKGWARTKFREVVRHHSGDSSLIKGRLHDSPGEGRIPAFSASGQDVWSDVSTGEGDAVIVSAVGARCGKAFLATGRWAAIANTHVVWPERTAVDHKFLWLRINDEHFWERGGTAQPFVLVRKTFEREWDLPPLEEQERIVAKLDALLSRVAAGEAAARRALERLKRYRAAVLHAAVTGELTRDWRKTHKPEETGPQLLKRLLAERRARWEEAELQRLQAAGKPPKDDKWKMRYPEPTVPGIGQLPQLPRGWIWVGWEQVGFSQNGRPFPSKEYTNKGVKLLRPGNLHPDGSVQWNEKNTRCLPAKFERENPDHIISGDELVINLTAQSLKDEFLGRVCLTSPAEHCLLNQRLARLTPVSGAPKYFLYMFKSSVFRRFVEGLNSGSLIQHMFTSQLGDFAFRLVSRICG